MKKQLLAGIMTIVFAGTCLPSAFASALTTPAASTEVPYAFIDNSATNSNNPIFTPKVNPPVGNPTWGTPNVPGTITKNPTPTTGTYKPKHNKTHKNKIKPRKHGTYKPATPNRPNRPSNPSNGTYKPDQPTRPSNPSNGTYKPSTPKRPNNPSNGTYKPAKPIKPSGTYKPTTPSRPTTGSRTKVHGAHWCYGACSLHDAGLHNAPRTQKHWCDGYR